MVQSGSSKLFNDGVPYLKETSPVPLQVSGQVSI